MSTKNTAKATSKSSKNSSKKATTAPAIETAPVQVSTPAPVQVRASRPLPEGYTPELWATLTAGLKAAARKRAQIDPVTGQNGLILAGLKAAATRRGHLAA